MNLKSTYHGTVVKHNPPAQLCWGNNPVLTYHIDWNLYVLSRNLATLILEIKLSKTINYKMYGNQVFIKKKRKKNWFRIY